MCEWKEKKTELSVKAKTEHMSKPKIGAEGIAQLICLFRRTKHKDTDSYIAFDS